MRILACRCTAIAERGVKPGVHDGVVGDVVGSDPDGHTLVRYAPLAIACRAWRVEPEIPPVDGGWMGAETDL